MGLSSSGSGGGGGDTSAAGTSGPTLSTPNGGLSGNFSAPAMSIENASAQPSAMQQLGQGYLQGLQNQHPLASTLLKALIG